MICVVLEADITSLWLHSIPAEAFVYSSRAALWKAHYVKTIWKWQGHEWLWVKPPNPETGVTGTQHEAVHVFLATSHESKRTPKLHIMSDWRVPPHPAPKIELVGPKPKVLPGFPIMTFIVFRCQGKMFMAYLICQWQREIIGYHQYPTDKLTQWLHVDVEWERRKSCVTADNKDWGQDLSYSITTDWNQPGRKKQISTTASHGSLLHKTFSIQTSLDVLSALSRKRSKKLNI